MDESTVIPDWLQSSAAALQTFLKAHPNAERDVSEILDPLLAKIDANTGGNVVAGMDKYFGTEITDMLFDLVQPDLGNQLPQFDKVIPTEAMAFLNQFIKKYGTQLANLTEATNASSAAALDEFLKDHVDAEEQVREILSKHLEKVGTGTWGAIITSLDNYWGKDCTNILIDIGKQVDQATPLDEVAKSASPDVMDLLRKVMALYGPQLATAFTTSNQLPNGWKMFYRDVYFDYVNRRPLIRVRLAKYNGEEPFVEGNADSILELAIFMLQTLRFLPAPDFIGKSMAERFIREANDFMKFLQPVSPEVSGTQAENKNGK